MTSFALRYWLKSIRVEVADIFSSSKRSKIMSNIRSTRTTPEEMLLKLLKRIGPQSEKILRHNTGLPGSPDFVFPKLKVGIFCDGCFFHSCPKHGHYPKSNKKYWKMKIDGNVKRDQIQRRKLRANGFAVWRFWEHDLRPSKLEKVEQRLLRLLSYRIGRNHN